MWLSCTPLEVQKVGGVRDSLACATRMPITLRPEVLLLFVLVQDLWELIRAVFHIHQSCSSRCSPKNMRTVQRIVSECDNCAES
jgi:hypothetical protein